MQVKPSPDALAQQMLLLTLALDHALGREDWEESNALFHRREQILDQLEAVPMTRSVNDVLAKIQVLEADMVDRLRTMQRSLAQDQRDQWESRRARRAYRGTGMPVSWDAIS
ncbi:MAG: hypothetical protein IT363_12400 [Methanoregulaceae archaeon]|jgi:hypothetical protein|nr:hypothetical protein [Methanoregulaceae archaeon]